MKAFLLAAGSGSRLGPLTDETPKCLLPIRGIPMLAVWLEICRQSGIDAVLINVHAHAAKVQDFIAGCRSCVDIKIVKECQLLGSAGTLAANRDFLECEEDFFVLYGDVLTNCCLQEMLRFHQSSHVTATLGVYRVPDPHRCGVVGFDGKGIVQSFKEKPSKPESNWAFSGIMIAKPELIDLVPAQRPADIGFHLLPQLVGRMAAYPVNAFLMDIGTLDNYQAAQSSWPGLDGELKKGSACYKA